MKEIGSEFPWNGGEKYLQTHNQCFDSGVLVFSGRTAIETVLKNEPSIRKAMLPAYCCDSMIEPFRRAGIELLFYPVFYEDRLKIELSIPDDVDCLLWCNYFGFKSEIPDLNRFVSRGGIIIEDITHSLFSEKSFHEQSHYLVASVRKWEPVLSGGYCVSRKGTLTMYPTEKPTLSFLDSKMAAMRMKKMYLDGCYSVDKEQFLQMFSQSNHWLAENYSGLAIDSYSKEVLMNADIQSHGEVRRHNARVLYEELKNNQKIRFMFEIEQMDCPLFVPVLIEIEKRDAVRKKLIENQIYCPVHWPRPNASCESNLYDMELSLICDQRYKIEDMHRVADVLRNV